MAWERIRLDLHLGLLPALAAAVAASLALAVPAAADPVPLAEFGTFGHGAGEIEFPEGIAIDGAGDLYVVDAGSNRIDEFGADGRFIRGFGWGVATGSSGFEVCTTATDCLVGGSGGGASALNGPLGIALDGAGKLFVSEVGNQRISVFDAAGPSFVEAFGWGVDTGASAFEVCTSASGCQAGSSGFGAGQLFNPIGVAVDAAGSLYVSEGAHRISVFDTAGPSFTHAFGWGVDTGTSAFEVCTAASTCGPGLASGGAGDLASPLGLAVDGAGGLYVGDSGNQRIDLFDTTGPSFTRAFGWGVDTGASAFEVCTTASACQAGSAGSAAGQLNYPAAVALDGAGRLYAGDQSNHRIDVFGTTGPSFTHAFGWAVDTGASAFEVCTTASTCQAGSDGEGVGQIQAPTFAAADCRGAVWVSDEGNSRVQRFGEPGTSLAPCTTTPPAGGGSAQPATGPTGQRAAAKRRCKKKFPKGPRRAKCLKRAKRLPV